MATTEVITALDQLKPYLNKNGVIEIARRGKYQRFTEFKNIILGNANSENVKEVASKLVSTINKNNNLNEGSTDLLELSSKLQVASVVLGALNLCTSCAGFVILSGKLNKVSGQINRIMESVNKSQNIQSNFEFNKALSEHNNMLDARKIKKYYTEEQMRQLVDYEYNVLKLLVDGFMNDLTEDKSNHIATIYSLAAMLTTSLKYFDELYYINNNENIAGDNVWHTSHDMWTSIFDVLLSKEFAVKIQDYCVLDNGLTTFETDRFYSSLCQQVEDMKTAINDNQILVKELGNTELVEAYENYINSEVASSIQEALEQTEGAMDDDKIIDFCQETMKRMALIV